MDREAYINKLEYLTCELSDFNAKVKLVQDQIEEHKFNWVCSNIDVNNLSLKTLLQIDDAREFYSCKAFRNLLKVNCFGNLKIDAVSLESKQLVVGFCGVPSQEEILDIIDCIKPTSMFKNLIGLHESKVIRICEYESNHSNAFEEYWLAMSEKEYHVICVNQSGKVSEINSSRDLEEILLYIESYI